MLIQCAGAGLIAIFFTSLLREGDFHSLGPRSRNFVAQNFRVLLSPEAKFRADERGSVKFLPLFGVRSLDKALLRKLVGLPGSKLV